MRKLLWLLAPFACGLTGPLYADSCQQLKSSSPHATITLARNVPAGTFVDDKGKPGPASLPDFCRVVATLTPSSDSSIGMELWLPTSGWNGKYMAVGSGGWGGSMNYQWMAEALRRGYA